MKKVITVCAALALACWAFADEPGLKVHRTFYGEGNLKILAICDEANGVMLYVTPNAQWNNVAHPITAVPNACKKALQ